MVSLKHELLDGWTVQDAAELYQVDHWADGFFGVSDAGHIEAYPNRNRNESIDLFELTSKIEADGVMPPALIRFPQIAQQRVRDIYSAFDRTIAEYQYHGKYTCIYPVKVSPHHDVVHSLTGGSIDRNVGLEAGSKAELLAVISSANNNTPILCNGFKDAQYIEMALHAVRLGRRVTIIVEKPSEFELIHRGVQRVGVKPAIGVRMKLAAKGVGHWESTGGTKSKFGLTISELLNGLENLNDWSLLDALEIVHFHLGSQITEIRYLKNAVIEATRIYADLALRGLPVRVIDVGGGLGIDYCGKRTNSLSSINYTWQEYANDVVYHIQSACDQAGVPHPDIYSESGRAMVAHHSVFMIPIIGQATAAETGDSRLDLEGYNNASPPVRDLRDTLLELSKRNLLESYHDAEQAMDMAGNMFRHGHLSLQERGDAEYLFREVCRSICDQLSYLKYVPDELVALEELLADNNFGNFSLFRSLPDHWAIGQLFPIAPIHRLDERPYRRAVLSDITCDSDGKVSCFVSSAGESTSLLLHRRNGGPYYLGVFLVGAYQEILGDIHNLFGQAHVVNVWLEDGELRLDYAPGDTMGDVLTEVGYNPADVLEQIDKAIQSAISTGRIDESTGQSIASFYDEVAKGYTYLSTGSTPHGELQKNRRELRVAEPAAS